MRKCVGTIELLGKCLKYYVSGNRSKGFGVEITETYVEKADHFVSENFEKALGVAQTLQKCSVFPTNLSEVIEDLNFGDSN